MKALIYSDWGVVKVGSAPDPVPAAGEVLIRVEACGICGSELEAFRTRSPRRPPPLILGHEFCGTVAATSPGDKSLRPGQKVVVNSVVSCGRCYACLRGESHLCASRQVFGMHRAGACAEIVAAPSAVVYPRPDGLTPVMGALMEPAANGVHVLRLLPHLKKGTVLVIGAGPVGLMVLQAARAIAGARTAVVDVKEPRLRAALDLGADAAVNATRLDMKDFTRGFTGADGFDFVVDAVGAAATKRNSLAACRPGGAVCWIGLHENEVAINSYDVTLLEKTVVGSYSATESDFRMAMDLACAGKLRAGSWVKTFALDEAASGFDRMLRAEGDDIKAVILPGGA